MGRERYGWANYGESEVIHGEDDLRDRVAPPVEGSHWRCCEAMVLQIGGRLKGKYLPCGRNPIELHHRLTRARGGLILDEAGEVRHLMNLCHEHHKFAHDSGTAISNGLLLEGYVTTCTQCRRPAYTGPDPYLDSRYGHEVHLCCVQDREGGRVTREDVRSKA